MASRQPPKGKKTDANREHPNSRPLPDPVSPPQDMAAEPRNLNPSAQPPTRRSSIHASPKAKSFPLTCQFCGRTANGISFFSRIFSSGKPSIEMPVLNCQSCHEREMIRPSVECWSPYFSRPMGSRLCHLTTEKISGYTKQEINRLFSSRRFEVSQFRHPRWQKTLWRIWFLGRPAKTNN